MKRRREISPTRAMIEWLGGSGQEEWQGRYGLPE